MYPDTHSHSAVLFDRAQRSLPGGNTRLTVYYSPYPIYAVRGEGPKIWDAEGNERLDFVNNYTALIHGHSHPKIVEAVQKQAAALMGTGMPTQYEIEFAELLKERLPGMDKVRFTNSGTESCMFAIRAARAYAGKTVIARVEGAYHGSCESMDSSQVADPDRWGPADAPVTVPNSPGIPASALSDVLTIPYNNIEVTRKLLEGVKGQLAGIMIDPFTPRLGFRRIDADYLAMLRQLCSAWDVALIFDEVMTFRVSYHGAQGAVGVIPDLTALGKIMAGGLPGGAVMGNDKYMDVFNNLKPGLRAPHGGTNNGNALVLAAGKAAMEAFTPNAVDHINNLAEYFRSNVTDALKTAGLVGRIHGAGSLSYLVLGDETIPNNFRDTKGLRLDADALSMLHVHLLNNGVQCADGYLYTLSTGMTKAHIDFTLEQMLAGFRRIRDAGLACSMDLAA